MDRRIPQLAKLQESFITHLVAPLCNAYGQAGLMPGVWQDEDKTGIEEELNLTLDDEAVSSDSECSSPKTKCRMRQIFCLHTQHIQENHQYWVAKMKVSQMCS